MSYLNMMYSFLGAVMRVMSALLFLGQLYVCQQVIHQRRKAGTVLLAALNALAGSLLFGVLSGDRDRVVAGASLRYQQFALRAYTLPWPVFLGLEAVFALLLFLFVRNIIRFSHRNVTPDTIKEAVDLLPVGICFGNGKGEALLANIRMTNLCFALTGLPMNNAAALWEAVRQKGENQDGHYLVRMADGTAHLFSRAQITMNGKPYIQFTAVDVTEQARVTADLLARNAKLWEVQYRMKAYHAQAMEMFMDEELLSARTEVHDGWGHLLLMGRAYLEHPEKTDEEKLLQMMEQYNRSMLADAEAPSPPADSWAEALRRADRLGVRIKITGDVPEKGRVRSLLGHALSECTANTVKHAGGDQVSMTMERNHGFLTAVFSNNGQPPEEPVQELGGLLSLRRMTEKLGGVMEIRSSPDFRLALTVPFDE